MSKREEGVVRVAIDSNAYRNVGFINYLKEVKQDVRVFIPSIVFLEIGYFFLSKGLSWAGYTKEIEKLGGVVAGWATIDNRRVIERSIAQRASMPFAAHFRDFVIGVQCEALQLDLITYNKRHFGWCEGIEVITPEEFAASMVKTRT
ncbi:MAG: hypothetical protein JW839_04370 [Candidatus Lokiarchaeota archaeon]|nr:hypothetical protein [Candidatus Lokiarchaeota archaeon]